jgi:Ni/Co efflux regulator RcnB
LCDNDIEADFNGFVSYRLGAPRRMTMNKYILLAAAAAMVAPSGAIAQLHNGRQDRSEVRHDTPNVRSGHPTMHADRQTLRADRHTMRSDRRNLSRNTGHRARSAYVAPVRNWSYRPVNVGYRLQPSFYGSRYYISDYSAYHVRAPSRWQQWIRYGNDLLLVNIRTGRVLRVIHYAGW